MFLPKRSRNGAPLEALDAENSNLLTFDKNDTNHFRPMVKKESATTTSFEPVLQQVMTLIFNIKSKDWAQYNAGPISFSYFWNMFSTKNFVIEGSDVPSTWVFQYYLDLPERLTGQDLKIKSIFNPNERTPSFCIYVDKTIMQYKFKDFSTGKSGNKIDLVKLILDINFSEAMRTIVSDYNKFMLKHLNIRKKSLYHKLRWEIDFINLRDWTVDDSNYWLSYRIGKSLLDTYNVKPIDYYNLIKEGIR